MLKNLLKNMNKRKLEEIYKDLCDEFSCTICMDLILDAACLSCGHAFCQNCIQKWFVEKKTCPQCRNNNVSFVPSKVIDNAIEKLLSQEEQKLRLDKKRERENEKDILDFGDYRGTHRSAISDEYWKYLTGYIIQHKSNGTPILKETNNSTWLWVKNNRMKWVVDARKKFHHKCIECCDELDSTRKQWNWPVLCLSCWKSNIETIPD